MSSLNSLRKQYSAKNEVATPVRSLSNEKMLKRMVLANMLWEDQFYIDGKTSAQLITDLVAKTDAQFVSHLAIAARSNFKLRHVPLLLTRELARNGKLTADTLNAVIQRPDEMSEFLSIYWKDKKTPLANQVKKGLAKAFLKFNEYSLAKWDKNSANISLRDVMFLVHAKPETPEQEILFKKVADQKLAVPDTWETKLSAGGDKRETFESLMVEKKLGALAFLRNLRNMVQSGISEQVIRDYSKEIDASRVLPFRYLAAARIVPQFEDMLEAMMFKSLESHKKLAGKTKVVIDVSGSMDDKISAKSDLTRLDGAMALAILMREICEDVEIWTFSTSAVRVAPRRGFALAQAITTSQSHGGTHLGNSLRQIGNDYDRIVVFTDEQSYDRPAAPKGDKGYIINVAAYKNGVNHDAWTAIDGFSEAVIDYMQALEAE